LAREPLRTYEVKVLGPLQVAVGGRVVQLPPAQRRLLSILLVDTGRSLSTDELIDRMWGEEPPTTARTALQVHVSKLRRVVPLETTTNGYRIEPGQVISDLGLLEEFAAEADRAVAAGDWEAAFTFASRASALERGRSLPDIADEPYASPVIHRIEQLLLSVAEVEVEAMLALGRNEAAIVRLDDLVVRHQFHDRLRLHLMLALYRAGRHGDALRAYQAYRVLLGETMGIEPGEDLRELEERILLHDPALGSGRPDTTPHNLPDVTSSFVGREDDIRMVRKELDDSGVVTITGGPGYGKTRLAVEVGRSALPDYPGGVWLARLSGADDARSVAATIAAAVSADDQISSPEDLAEAIRPRPLLLILDNCEHVTEAVGQFLLALNSKPRNCRVLVTCRRRLGEPGGPVHRLEPLSGGIDQSIALLADRVRSVNRGFAITPDNLPALRELAERLGGVPLAIELVARWVPTLGLHDITRLLGRVHSDDALTTAFEWSVALLPEGDRRLLGSLAVFESAVTLERTTDVCGDGDDLAVAGSVSRLIDASLLALEWSGMSAHYRMPQPVRDMAWAGVDARRRKLLGDRHTASHVRSAEALSEESVSDQQARAFARLDAEIPDYRRAMARLIEGRAWGELTLVIDALSRYWYARFLGWEARQWIAEIPMEALEPDDRARLHRVAGFLAWSVHDYEQADRHYQALHALGVAGGDRRMKADGLYGRGLVHQKRRYLDGAAMLEEAATIYEGLPGCEVSLGECLLFRGLDEAYTGDVARAEGLLARAADLLELAGHVRQVSKARRWLSHCAWRRGDEADARLHARNAEQLARSTADQIALGGALVEKAHIAITWGTERDAADQLLEAWLPIPPVDEIDRAQVLFPAARLAVRTGDLSLAASIVSHVDDVYDRHGWRPFDEIVGVAELRTAVVGVDALDGDVEDRVQEFLTRLSTSA
jgi:predicted ATPase/DNA-binding SARP family transcriptional activator